MTPLERELRHRATAVPWSPSWQAVLDAYLVGGEMFPRYFKNRRPA